MPERIIDFLEMVQIYKNQTQRCLPALAKFQIPIDADLKIAPIFHLCQIVSDRSLVKGCSVKRRLKGSQHRVKQLSGRRIKERSVQPIDQVQLNAPRAFTIDLNNGTVVGFGDPILLVELCQLFKLTIFRVVKEQSCRRL